MNEPSRDDHALLTAALRLSAAELDRRDAELRDGRVTGLDVSEFEAEMRRHLARQNP